MYTSFMMSNVQEIKQIMEESSKKTRFILKIVIQLN